MTPQEQTMLGDLISRVQSTSLTEKDPDAQNLLNQQLSRHPDALYVLAQTVLVQNYALDQAKKQMEQLKQQAVIPQPPKATSFLGSIFGHTDKESAPPQGQYAPVPQQQYAQAPPSSQWSTPQGGQAYQQQGYPPQAYPPPSYGAPQSGPPSFLRSAATTAAGVAAGALAFEGVESLMHGFGQHAGFGGGGFGGEGFGGGGFGGAPREEVINNYYGSQGGEGRNDDRDDGRVDRYEAGSGREDASSRDMPAIQDASYTGPQSNDDLQPEVDQADDVSVSDDGGSYDDASDNSGSDDSSFV